MAEDVRDGTRPVYVRKLLPSGWHLLIWVQPGAGKSECVGPHDGCLRIRLAAPAVDNKANEALIVFVAEILGVRTSRVRLLAGRTSRRKRLALDVEEEPDWTRLI